MGVGIQGPGDPVTEDGLFQDVEVAVKALRALEPQGRDAARGVIDGAVKGDH